jgi:hypothetical protein
MIWTCQSHVDLFFTFFPEPFCFFFSFEPCESCLYRNWTTLAAQSYKYPRSGIHVTLQPGHQGGRYLDYQTSQVTQSHITTTRSKAPEFLGILHTDSCYWILCFSTIFEQASERPYEPQSSCTAHIITWQFSVTFSRATRRPGRPFHCKSFTGFHKPHRWCKRHRKDEH